MEFMTRGILPTHPNQIPLQGKTSHAAFNRNAGEALNLSQTMNVAASNYLRGHIIDKAPGSLHCNPAAGFLPNVVPDHASSGIFAEKAPYT